MSALRIVVSGYAALLPTGGVAWDYLQYALGLFEMGHDVYYIEDTKIWPIYQDGSAGGSDCSHNVGFLSRAMSEFGMSDRWAYRDEASDQWYGKSEQAVEEILRTTDVLINVSCALPLDGAYSRIPVRMLIDSDPMFTQLQQVNSDGFTVGSGSLRASILAHSHHFTFGECVGQPHCRMPVADVTWTPTRQPVVMSKWSMTTVPTAPDAAFTTVMNWSAAKSLTWQDESWGQKDVEFMKVIDLPTRFVTHPLSVAMSQTGGAPFPTERIRAAGWNLLDAAQHVSTPQAYQQFINRSFGEFSVAKETYVKANTGWFSCRSACYLAAGRPVVAQDTGWTRILPSNEGLLAFTDADSALVALDLVASDPSRHGRRAREIAEHCFDSRRVLGGLLQAVSA